MTHRLLVVSSRERNRVTLGRTLATRDWQPVVVATWERAAARGLQHVIGVVTDTSTLTVTSHAARRVLAALPADVPVFVIAPQRSIPSVGS